MSRFLAHFGAAIAGVAFLSVASCGSRTGLFGPEGQGLLPDGALPDGAFPDGPIDGAVPCLPGRFDMDLATAQLMFVIDRSRSMRFYLNRDIEAPLGSRRWDILRSALDGAISPFDQQLAMGAKFFPEAMSDEDATQIELACATDTGVGLAPKRGNAQSILSVFDTTTPLGGTPTAEAVRLAAQFLIQNRGVSRTLVLATDGAPNCNGDLDNLRCTCTTPDITFANDPRYRYNCLDDTRTIDTIREIADVQKVPVYVIGIGSLGRPAFLKVLDDMAVAGGRPRPTEPRHYNVQTASELGDALTTIRDSVAKCTYLTPSSPIDPNAISVEIDGVQVFRDPTRKNGWDWVDQSYGELAFFGAACERAQAGTAKVTGVVSCEKD
jgi:hypothetical protein